MPDYGVTDKGFQMRRLDEIYTDICKRFKDEVGVDPSENPQSVMNVLFTIFADAPAELWEAYAAAYQQLFPNTACGVALDNVMQVGGVSRIGQAKTKYFISCTGQEGTVIPVGALIQSSSRPQRTFQAVSASIISSANWRKLAIRPIESIAGTFTFDFGVSRNATSGEVGTYGRAELDAITLTSQSEQKCIDCPVSAGCGWCSGLNYEMYGTANRRFTGICWAHKARVLASAYYHNRRYIEIGDCLPIKAELPKDDALEILPAADYEEFLKIERAALLKFADENGIS